MADTDRDPSPLGQGQDGVVVMNSLGTGLWLTYPASLVWVSGLGAQCFSKYVTRFDCISCIVECERS